MRRCQFGVAGVASLAMTLAAAMATAADSDTREVAGTRHDKSAAATAAAPASAMQELIETLHDNGTTADAAYQRLKAVAAADAEDKRQQPAPTVTKVSAQPPASSVSTKDGLLKFRSSDGSEPFQVGGRIQVDAAVYAEDKQ